MKKLFIILIIISFIGLSCNKNDYSSFINSSIISNNESSEKLESSSIPSSNVESNSSSKNETDGDHLQSNWEW